MRHHLIAGMALAGLLYGTASAGEADTIKASAVKSGGTWRFDVTVRHGDTGWDHYADAWRIVGPDGTVYGTRTLYHPHVNEQPFTRSLSGVKIPGNVSTVTVESRDSVHGWGGATVTVTLN
jgi:hypothetical protein